MSSYQFQRVGVGSFQVKSSGRIISVWYAAEDPADTFQTDVLITDDEHKQIRDCIQQLRDNMAMGSVWDKNADYAQKWYWDREAAKGKAILMCPHGIDRDKSCPTCQVEKPLQSIELREDYL